MQNPSPTTAAHPGHLGQPWTNPNMYPNSSAHQRNPANPRSYDGAPAPSGQPGDDQYANYPQFGNVPGMGGGGGGYPSYSGNSGVNNVYTSPSLPSGSRRTSNPKASPTTSNAAATSPSTYYPRGPVPQADANQSPYQQNASIPQGVTASPQQQSQYGNYYPQYDQYGGHHQGGGGGGGGQWPQHQYAPSNFSHQPVQQRQASAGSMGSSAAPGVNEQSQPQPQQQQQPPRHGGSFDYSSQQGQPQPYGGNQSWDPSRQAPNHQWQQPPAGQQPPGQQQSQRPPGSSGGQQPPPAMSPWQGYPAHHPFPPPPQPVPQMGGQLPPGQYGWNQWGGQGYYPQGGPHPHPGMPQPPPQVPNPQAAAMGAAPLKKSKSKKDSISGEPEQLLGKRPADIALDDDKSDKNSKHKKGKKEEEKPVPKAPTKSHLKPPRQAPSAWQLFFADELNKAKEAAAAEAGTTPGGTPIHPKLNVAQIAKDAGVAYANLDSERKAYYQQKVEEGKVQYQKELAAWQSTLTPEDIKTENAFRAQQRKEGKSRKGNLKDPNAPKKPLSAYFLFLKGIRENEDLRNSVWGEETETTRQSVLAAERWRGLSDEEKKPYLQQAEKDKQEYEALRKVYEDDAAARQRGETVPDRPQFTEVQSAVINPPKSLLEPRKEPLKEENKTEDAPAEDHASVPSGPASVDPAATTLTVIHESTPDPDTAVPTAAAAPAFDAALEIDEFHGFDDMDLTGLEGMTGHGDAGDAQWDHLQYMQDADGNEIAAVPAADGAASSGSEVKSEKDEDDE